ncbi:MAG: hypothetical protein LQ348_002634 [Seirophora lacunosa]|nr:MAG: hypothetical protein LQ348_002634 [Seirophora lacunosa]
MATQAMLIADTIAGMKRALARSKDTASSSDSEDSIDRCTNRGNKLKRKARYVHEGQLDRPSGPKVYKRKIEHAGYHRDVISRNPHRYDDDGEKLDEDDDDEAADIAAAEVDPYHGILLHELLGPLTSGAHLPVHPSLSVPYKSPILSNMLQDACAMVHRERNTIRGARQLLTKLRGDGTWLPCSTFVSDIDRRIFDTSKVYEEFVRLRPLPTLAKRNGALSNGAPLDVAREDKVQITSDNQPSGLQGADSRGVMASRQQEDDDKPTEDLPRSASLSPTENNTREPQSNGNGTAAKTHDETTARHDFELQSTTGLDVDAGTEIAEGIKASTSDKIRLVDPIFQQRRKSSLNSDGGKVQQMAAGQSGTDNTHDPGDGNIQDGRTERSAEGEEDLAGLEEEASAANDALQPIAHRMRTRAQAQAASDNTTIITHSPSVASSLVPSIHPLFLIPDEACPDRDFGLPPDEAEATRRILMSYVQKQEEVCRGAEKLYNGLLKAKWMKDDVFDSCKAEEHVGEMSDGEDWYDKEAWGLDEDLRKGHDEEEDEAGTQHKKTRRRAAAA